MIAVVDLEEAVAVAAVADDVPAAVAIRASRLLSGDGREQAWVQTVALGGRLDLRGEAYIHSAGPSPSRRGLTRRGAGSTIFQSCGGPAVPGGAPILRLAYVL